MDGTTTPAEYETACARFSVISEHAEALHKFIATLSEAVEAEYSAAGEELRQHERQPGIHKPYAGGAGELTISQINEIHDAAVPRLAALLPWAADVIK